MATSRTHDDTDTRDVAGFRVYASNRLEVLAERLAATMRDDPLGPLEREVIVVQSRGMYRWLTLELAKRLGIAATIATPFPGTFCRALAERIEGRLLAGPGERYEPAEPSPFDREILAWRIFRLLREGPSEARGPAAAYIEDDPDQRKRFQLATRLAERFDEYQLYRPDLLLAWEHREQPIAGAAHRDTATWQAGLWRALVSESGESRPHLARRFTTLTRSLHENETTPRGLPRRVSVFGAASLPPIFLDLLVAVARFASVSVYVVSPTREYWSDIRPPREVAKQLDMFREKSLADAEAHVEVGNPLLASLGRQGRELAGLLHERDADGSAWHDLRYEVPERRTVLGTIQADIVELVDRNVRADAPRVVMAEDDRSVEIHVCHSPMREMQVLRDAILDAFATDPDLRPHDVFVLAPDIAKYAPFIEAVFGVAHDGEPSLPFTIADRSARGEQPVVDAAFRVLEAVGTRATASDVLSLLDAAPIRRGAGITLEQLSTVRDWVGVANIRWGIDGSHRRDELALPCDDFDTWRAGLDRLLLGYAIGDADLLVSGTLPRGVAAGDADLLGRFAVFADRLFGRLRALAAPRSLEGWAADIRAALDELIVPDGESDERALEQVRAAVDTLVSGQGLAGVTEDVALEVVRERLRAQMDLAGGGAGFITGAITFCSLKPMRAIPAKLVCIAGLDNGTFPHRDRPASFDLLAVARRPGDRSPRDDDRYTFLEAIASARERLVLSYVGRSQKDNSELAPSSALSELVDVIDATFAPMAGRSAHENLMRVHALQPFSAQYFVAGDRRPAAPFSYSKENRRAATAIAAATDARRPFLDAPLVPETAPIEISLADLTEFWISPSKYFCTRVLRLRLPRDDGELADSEPFERDSLASYLLSSRVLERRLAGEAAGDDELALLQATLGLPHADLGRARYAQLDEEVREFIDTLLKVSGGKPAFREPLAIAVDGAGWRLTGVITNLTEAGALRYRLAKLKPKDRIRAWIPHVVLNALASSPAPVTTVVAEDHVFRFDALTDAAPILQSLVQGYVAGIVRPPPLLEQSSFAYADSISRSTQEPQAARAKALDDARGAFGGVPARKLRGDVDDASVRIVFRDDPLLEGNTEPFERTALDLWGPLLEATQKVSRKDLLA